MKKPRSRIIRALQLAHPDRTWRIERCGFGYNYISDNGWIAHWVAALAPRYDGDDDSFERQFWIYKTATGEIPELVYGL
jgi:hypothetical protein